MKLSKKSIALVFSIFAFAFSTVSAVDACRCRENCNSKDVAISLNLDKDGAWKRLGSYRSKNNAHSVYFCVGSDTTVDCGAFVKVIGIDTNSGYRRNSTMDKNENHVDFVVVQKTRGNCEYQIYNDLYESGYRVCDLEFAKRDLQNNGKKIAGWWSPDYCSGYGEVTNIAPTPRELPPCP